MPISDTQIESDYTAVIESVSKNYRSAIEAADKNTADMVDYYTMWAHQIKTPISAMKMILQADDTKENGHLLAELFKMEQYVEFVLVYIRLDSTTTDLIFEKYPLDEIIEKRYENTRTSLS